MKILKTIGKVVAVLSAIAAALTALSMVVYYFNLDMKLTSLLEEPLEWWYDRIERDRGI